ncbi:hypothetical protein SuNHUV7_22370 (plasmid) [Pseudoseohaeicola sp. NH-UV-7]|uniref:hypothetical protein n=1 Tax=Sulfitobacter sp. TBRI5 TaxID=2989732 RepID=UPI003A6526BB
MPSKYARPVTTANPDWHQATCAQDLVPVLPDPDGLAERFVTLAGKTMLTQGPMAGRRLEQCWLPWQRDALKASFQCRETLWVLGKGSGKSVSVAAFALGYTMLSASLRINTRGLIAVLAPTIPAAKIVFDHITQAVLADDELRPLFKSNAQNRSLTHMETGIEIQVLACDMKAAVGRRPVLLILDETHELATINGASAVVNQLKQGGANWGRDFKTVSISTMPISAPVGEFKRQLTYARAVRSGEIDDPDFLPLLFTFPLKERPDLDPTDPSQWWRGMPSLRSASNPVGTMDATELERELKQAADASDLETFALTLSQRLGIERNDSDANAETVLHSHWSKCERPTRTDYDFTAIGIDAGGTDDPMAVCIASRHRASPRNLDMTVFQYLTRMGYERAPENLRDTYDEAVKRGTLRVFERSEDMQQAVFDLVREIRPDIVGGDEHGISGFAQALRQATSKTFTSVPQTWVLGAALASLESRLLDGAIRHNNCPLLAANVDNLLVEELPTGNRRLKKRDNRISGQALDEPTQIVVDIVAVRSEHICGAPFRGDIATLPILSHEKQLFVFWDGFPPAPNSVAGETVLGSHPFRGNHSSREVDHNLISLRPGQLPLNFMPVLRRHQPMSR